ncbi:MAG: GNAT family N-acetyltransferase [Alphaproteobacteria bacterium]|nr:GNAT family N-acetyltransferase [Alphaproteobacteria bacterium]
MSSSRLIFTTTSVAEWDKKIAAGLRQTCKRLSGIHEDFRTHSIYAKFDEIFAGGITFEQRGNILWLDALWVEPNFRNHGTGKQLMEKVIQFSVQNNVKEIQLNTYFPDAHAFFLVQGFEDVAVIPNWKYGLDCYMMRKKICPPKL